VIEIIQTAHPRLFINADRISELMQLMKTDSFFAGLSQSVIRKADELLTMDVVPFQIVGPRMLKNCQEIHRRVATLSFCSLLTGDNRYAIRAKDEMMSAADYPHWNKDHFLDTAELITAFAIGYDWLYDVLPKPDLAFIKKTMIEKGIQPGLEEHKKNIWWAGHKYNWNQVCNGGLIIGALSVADEEPALCKEVFEATVKYLPIAFNSYGKDGGWEAGPDYWKYTTWYSVLLIDALQTITGNDFGLSATEGFDKTGYFPIYCAGPADKYFNFGDAGENVAPVSTLFWLGKKFSNESFISENHRLLKKALADNEVIETFNLIWYSPPSGKEISLPTKKCFNDIHVGSFRSEWKNAAATFIGFKGGNNQADHGNLDLGSFVLDMKGVRWAVDLGRDSYDLPNYFNRTEGGGRWNYFRTNTKSHNTLVLNNDIQRATAKAKLISCGLEGDAAVAIIDLSEAYAPHAHSATRKIKMISSSEIIITDRVEWAGEEKHIRWQLLTDAEIALQGNKAELIKEGQKIVATIIQPANADFEIVSAEQSAPEMNNEGYRQLVLNRNEKNKISEIVICISES
jgi:Heparinase II/III-like protein/Domain of unknown function (DUF4962)